MKKIASSLFLAGTLTAAQTALANEPIHQESHAGTEVVAGAESVTHYLTKHRQLIEGLMGTVSVDLGHRFELGLSGGASRLLRSDEPAEHHWEPAAGAFGKLHLTDLGPVSLGSILSTHITPEQTAELGLEAEACHKRLCAVLGIAGGYARAEGQNSGMISGNAGLFYRFGGEE